MGHTARVGEMTTAYRNLAQFEDQWLEHSIEPSGSIEGDEYLRYLSEYSLLKKNSGS
jgi:hypothetical protein